MTAPGPFAATSLQGEWTTDTLHQFLIRMLAEMDLRYEQRYAAESEARRLAMDAANAALDQARATTAELVAAAERRAAARDDAIEATMQTLLEGIRAAQLAAIADGHNRIVELSKLTDAKFVTFRTLIDSQGEKVALALSATDKETSKTERTTEKRFESVNEFRAQLADQARTFMPRSEAETRIASAAEKVSDMGDRLSTLMPRSEAVARADANADKITRLGTDLNDVSARITAIESRSGGHADSTKNLMAIVSLIIGALAIAVTIIIATR